MKLKLILISVILLSLATLAGWLLLGSWRQRSPEWGQRWLFDLRQLLLAGWAGTAHNDWRRANPSELAATAVRKARESRNPVAIEPGRYTVVGQRAGYRDVRREITLVPGREAPAVVIRCEEPI